MVALKELVFALVPTAQQLDAFEREARMLGSVSHPQIPRLIDSFREGDGPSLRLYLAQELVEGEPLSKRIGIDETEARAIARQLLNILSAESSTATSSRPTSCAAPTERSRWWISAPLAPWRE